MRGERLLSNLSLAKLLNYVGQVVNLRPIGDRPTARPAKLFRRSRQPCSHWIHLDVSSDSLELRLITNQPIVALVLLERPPGQSKYLIAFRSRESLKRLHRLANLNKRRHQEMNVIGHHDIGVKLVVPRLTMVDGFRYHACDFRDAKEKRDSACGVENPVHGEECLAGGGFNRETAVRRKTAVQAPCDEDRLADGMIVRKAAASKSSHLETVAGWEKILRKVKRPIANRPQVTNLPHKASSRPQLAAGTAGSRHRRQQQPVAKATGGKTVGGREVSG
jgi:hypothetical protein